jgi:beta-lactamase class D
MKITITIVAAALLIAITCAVAGSTFNNQVKDLYKKHNATGSFVLYDLNNNEFNYYDEKRCERRFCPASTFKIPNSIIGLECRSIDPEAIIKWDGTKRAVKGWNQDHNLKSAYSHSVVPYYQDLARKIGVKKMRQYLKQFDYGNMDCSGEIDRFWLNGTIQITQKEQIKFLKKLYQKKLGISQRTDSIMNDIMVFKQTDDYTIKAKTGASTFDKVGWFVGWVETKDNVFFFANNLSFEGDLTTEFMKKRIVTTLDILRDSGVID